MARCWQTFITIFEKNIKIVFLLFKCKEKKNPTQSNDHKKIYKRYVFIY